MWSGRYGRSQAKDLVRKAIDAGFFVQKVTGDGDLFLIRVALDKVGALLGVARITSRGQERPLWELLRSSQVSAASTHIVVNAECGRRFSRKRYSRATKAKRLGVTSRTTRRWEKRLAAEAREEGADKPFRSRRNYALATTPSGSQLGADSRGEATQLAIDRNLQERSYSKYRVIARQDIYLKMRLKISLTCAYLVVMQLGNSFWTDAAPGSAWKRRRLNCALAGSSVTRADRPHGKEQGASEDSRTKAHSGCRYVGAVKTARRPPFHDDYGSRFYLGRLCAPIAAHQ